nr:hypothetical protein [Tanacetum cinerariifolium]
MDEKKKFDLNLEIFKDIFHICPRVHGQNFNELSTDEDIMSFFKELGHTREIKSITDVVVDQMHQPWRNFATIINRSLSGNTIGVTPPKKESKFKKPASPKLFTVIVSSEEPTRKSKRVKRPAKKSTNVPIAGVVMRETLMMSLSKKKEKVSVEKCKEIDLLYEVALTEEAQYEEVRKKSLVDFHKTRPSGSGTVTKIAPSATKIKPSISNEGTDDSNNDHDSRSEGIDQESDSGDDNTRSDNEKGSDFEHETDENEMGSKSDQEENEEEVEDDKEEKDEEFVKTPPIYTDDKYETNDESKVEEKLKEGTDTEMINVQQGNENPKILINKIIEDAHVTISTVPKKTKVLVTSSSYSSNLAFKFLNFSDIPHTDAEIISPMDVHVHHEDHRASQDLTTSDFAKEVSNFAPPMIKSMVTESIEHAVLAKVSSRPKSTYEAAASLIEFELKKILIDKMDGMYSLKRSRKDKDKDEDPSAGSDLGLKKRKTSKDDETTKVPKAKNKILAHSKAPSLNQNLLESLFMQRNQSLRLQILKCHKIKKRIWTPQQGPTQSWLMTLASSADKPSKTFDELMSTPIDFSTYIMNGLKITNLTQETLLGPAFKLLKGTRTNFVELEYDFEECYKALSKKLDWENLEGGDY